MGGSFSRGYDNQSLMDELLKSGTTLSPELERVMRLVDRGDYCDEKSSQTYTDLPWSSGNLHLSGPNIYCLALQNLDVKPGCSFLNIGSGTGYFSTVIGLLLGYNGINHGIEVHESNVKFARERLISFMNKSDAPFERSFCVPTFTCGNIFDWVVSGKEPTSTIQNSSTNSTSNTSFNLTSNSIPLELFLSVDPVDGLLNEEHNSLSDDMPQIEENQQEIQNQENVEAVLSVPMDVEQDTDFEEETGDEDSDANNSIQWDEEIVIESPPFYNLSRELVDEQDSESKKWLLYDRIYVGAAITNSKHLQSILRLLKIGGIMICPYRDKFIKIERISENRISASHIFYVRFASLLRTKSLRMETPPQLEVASLEQLCARTIRKQLKNVIEYRHKGLPTLGRLQVVESTESNSTESNDIPHTESSSDFSDSIRIHPLARFLHYLVSHRDLGLFRATDDDPVNETWNLDRNRSNRNSSEDITEVTDNADKSSVDTPKNCSYVPNNDLECQSSVNHTNATKENNSTSPSNEPDNSTNHDETNSLPIPPDEKSSESKNCQKPKWENQHYQWIEPSYTFKEEMKQILLNELKLGKHFVLSVMTL